MLSVIIPVFNEAGRITQVVKDWFESEVVGEVIVADGTKQMQERLNRVLTNDPGLGVARHYDAGYNKAISIAKDRNLNIPIPKK